MPDACCCAAPKKKKRSKPKPKPCCCNPSTPQAAPPPPPCPPPPCPPPPCPPPADPCGEKKDTGCLKAKDFTFEMETPTGTIFVKGKPKPKIPKCCPPIKVCKNELVHMTVDGRNVCVSDPKKFQEDWKTPLGKIGVTLDNGCFKIQGFKEMMDNALRLIEDN